MGSWAEEAAAADIVGMWASCGPHECAVFDGLPQGKNSGCT